MGIAAAIGLLMTGAISEAAVADRSDFGPSATEFGFDGFAVGTTTVNPGILTITGGTVQDIARGSLIAPTYLEIGSGNIEIAFSSAVSSFGLDFNSRNTSVALSVFDALDTLIESVTIGVADQVACGGFLCGFAGLDVGSLSIAKAIISTGGDPTLDNVFVDNLIYDMAVVPLPAGLGLLMTGLGGLVLVRRRGQSEGSLT
ncbi:VPLPA-CTERM sorting domain-containing protein [Tropicimonas sp. TH_r6]|uniref:VPLPA-CTERM sorting domain-containing protein n=1 Tax=Tropicimonas sp. TH_r6 TaxID=3082085 RepID=UPI002954F378|nr:VPLPA-CTERM sorting domain-containing protein [Tropicimonas sp. TH_r6]MDV7143377.1 VPLPA-CTERM sorting domain-containing protein [Tropicimonas sp. TH_r6]